MQKDSEKIILVINLAFLGDILLSNPLVANIKNQFPDSKIVFMTNKPFVNVGKYLRFADDVICIDKNGSEKGLIGLMKYANSSPYKNKIFASFVIYNNDRGIILSKLLNAKNIISGPKFLTKHLLTHTSYAKGLIYMPDINNNLLEVFTGRKPQDLPSRYDPPCEESDFVKELKNKYKNTDVIGICAVSKAEQKDMSPEIASEIIEILSAENKKVFYFGQGQRAKQHVQAVKNLCKSHFEDLVNSTSIVELAQLLKFSKALISVDTGTLHLGYSVDTPVVATFYGVHDPKKWMPNENLYKAKVLLHDYEPKSICNNLNMLLEKHKNKV